MVEHVRSVKRRLKRPIILFLCTRHSKVHFFIFGVKLKIDCIMKVDLCIGDCCMQRTFSTINTFLWVFHSIKYDCVLCAIRTCHQRFVDFIFLQEITTLLKTFDIQQKKNDHVPFCKYKSLSLRLFVMRETAMKDVAKKQVLMFIWNQRLRVRIIIGLKSSCIDNWIYLNHTVY